MNDTNLTLIIEINKFNFIFLVGKNNEQNIIEKIFKIEAPICGIKNSNIINFDQVFKSIKENVFQIEQKFNYTFKEIILILENFNPTFLNISGYKNLNGSQILRENVTYILNTLKSNVNKVESKKTILHIFNSNFYLDKKKIENLPIGLFGDFYSHELSFSLINTNDYNNLKNIFDKCNLKIKKILLKSFIKGAFLSDNNKNIETFFLIQINNDNSKIFYFENNSLKFEQDFKFGTNIILQDISKITSLKIDDIKNILKNTQFKKEISEEELVESENLNQNINRKIKKKLIYDIALARIKEISEIIIFRNINLRYYNQSAKNIFLEISNDTNLFSFKELFSFIFSEDKKRDLYFNNNLSKDDMLEIIKKLVHFGWKKEAIPTSHAKRSIVARFFDALFS